MYTIRLCWVVSLAVDLSKRISKFPDYMTFTNSLCFREVYSFHRKYEILVVVVHLFSSEMGRDKNVVDTMCNYDCH